MSITEKELSEKLTGVYHDGADLEQIMRNIARRAAELLGVTLAPEKPEPGIYVLDGKPVVIYSDEGGKIGHHVDSWNASRPVPDRHRIKPARVISEAEYQRLVNIRADEDANPADDQYAPAKPVVLTEEEVGGVFQNASFNYHWSRLPALDGMRPSDMQEDIIRFAHALLAKHGGARELPGRGKVRDAISNAQSLKVPPSDIEAAADAVIDLMGGGDRGE